MAPGALKLILGLLGGLLSAAELQPRQAVSIPDYVNTYAPLVYLDQNEIYLPSDIQAQLNNTKPTLNFTVLLDPPSPLTLSDLSTLNSIAGCTSFSNCSLYLTSRDDPSKNPPYLYGVLPNSSGKTIGATSCAIIVNDHGDGTVDAFYMFFYAFNCGLQVAGSLQGNHVGDWEHVMIRFLSSKPSTMWFSQHDNGQVFTWDTLQMNGSRPVVYSAIGSHANFAVAGTHTRTLGGLAINDYTSAGPLWDPVKSAYYYTYSPSILATLPNGNGTFVGVNGAPTPWLYYLGAWGDEQYPDSDPRQTNLFNLSVSWTFVSGPTGPLDKVLHRAGTCPSVNCTTLNSLPSASGSSIPVTVTRTSAPPTSILSASSNPGSATGGSKSSSSGGVTSITSAAAAEIGRAMETGMAVACLGLLAAML